VLLSPRDRVALEVGGGTATLIPGTVVNVHCPVRRRYRRGAERAVWRRTTSDDGVIGSRGRVKVNFQLSILRGGPKNRASLIHRTEATVIVKLKGYQRLWHGTSITATCHRSWTKVGA